MMWHGPAENWVVKRDQHLEHIGWSKLFCQINIKEREIYHRFYYTWDMLLHGMMHVNRCKIRDARFGRDTRHSCRHITPTLDDTNVKQEVSQVIWPLVKFIKADNNNISKINKQNNNSVKSVLKTRLQTRIFFMYSHEVKLNRL